MPPTLTLVIALPTVSAVVVLFGALSLVGLIDPSDPDLQAMGCAPAYPQFVRRPVRRRRPCPVQWAAATSSLSNGAPRVTRAPHPPRARRMRRKTIELCRWAA
jgi:hypothetical protein